MGGPKYISTFPKWMSDMQRRVEKLERRKHHRAYVRSAQGAGGGASFTASAAQGADIGPDTLVTLAVGTVLRDNGDGTLTVIEAPGLVEFEEL